MYKIICTFLLLIVLQSAFAQVRRNTEPQNRGANTGSDTAAQKGVGFEHRDDAKDSITVSFKWLDSIRSNPLDTNLNDFYKYFPAPVAEQYLGSNGAAAYSLIFSPFVKPGWDAGFHAFDVYHFTLENTRFFKTTKPFTQLGYQIASGKEQMIKILHTQSPRPNFNFGFEYRLISAPGFFISQNSTISQNEKQNQGIHNGVLQNYF